MDAECADSTANRLTNNGLELGYDLVPLLFNKPGLDAGRKNQSSCNVKFDVWAKAVPLGRGRRPLPKGRPGD